MHVRELVELGAFVATHGGDARRTQRNRCSSSATLSSTGWPRTVARTAGNVHYRHSVAAAASKRHKRLADVRPVLEESWPANC